MGNIPGAVARFLPLQKGFLMIDRPRRPPPARPVCPLHDVPLLVGRTRGRIQYRYCPVAGCHESIRTVRQLPARTGAARAPEGALHE
jgi:hypothetical protein